MGNPTWREINKVKVPERTGCFWTPALDNLTPGKLYRLQVRAVPTVRAAPVVPAVLAAPAVVQQAHDAPPAVVQQPHDAPPAAVQQAHDAPPAVVQQAHDAPPAIVQQAHDAPPAVPAAADAAAAVQQPPARPALQDQMWKPESAAQCTADGDPTTDRADGLLIDTCAVGALIAKIGGSTAELKPDKAMVFGVGRYCVFSADATKTGALFLGINDTYASVARVQNQLEVIIDEAL